MGLVYASYDIWPVTQLFAPGRAPGERPCILPKKSAGSWATCCCWQGPSRRLAFLTDVALGLINRFASQLNVYVLAMPIKCGIAAFLLCFYFGLLLSHAPELFDFTRNPSSS